MTQDRRGSATNDHTTPSLMRVEEVLERLRALTGEPLEVEQVGLIDALGRVLAGPVTSALDLPPWDNSAMDGFAVRADDTRLASAETPVRLAVVGDSRAGRQPEKRLGLGQACRIATGAPVPAGADAVVPVEATTVVPPADAMGRARARTDGFESDEPLPAACELDAPVTAGAHIRRAGEDVRVGTLVVEAGQRLRPAQISMIAGVGHGNVIVRRRPLVGILSTGDELRQPGVPLGAAGIPDANRPGLLALATAAGAEVRDLGIARDERDEVVAALRAAVETCDVVVVSGGVSVGPYDHVRFAFDQIGDVELWRVAIQPGKPFAFGRAAPRSRDGRRPLLVGLPGNPVAALVTFELFVRPVLGWLVGLDEPARADRAVTEDPLRASAGRRGFVRVLVERDARGDPSRDHQGLLRVRLAGGQGSHMLSAMAAADALAVVPEDVERIEAGSEVEIRWLSQ